MEKFQPRNHFVNNLTNPSVKKDTILEKKTNIFLPKPKCARCSDSPPNHFDSFRNKINFCVSCKNHLTGYFILNRVTYQSNFSFKLEILFLENHNVFKILIPPQKIRIVEQYPSIIRKHQQFHFHGPRIKLEWSEIAFLEEIYNIEWTSKHILDQILLENEIMNKKLF